MHETAVTKDNLRYAASWLPDVSARILAGGSQLYHLRRRAVRRKGMGEPQPRLKRTHGRQHTSHCTATAAAPKASLRCYQPEQFARRRHRMAGPCLPPSPWASCNGNESGRLHKLQTSDHEFDKAKKGRNKDTSAVMQPRRCRKGQKKSSHLASPRCAFYQTSERNLVPQATRT